MNKQPLVSVLVPIYNVAIYLPKCLDTLLHQSYANLQVVLVDDGSIDDSFAICRTFEHKDSRVQVYHKDNSGVASTRNDLLSYIQGDFFLFVDSDDWVELDMVEELLRLQSKTNADITMCGVVVNASSQESSISDKFPNELFLSQQDAIEQFLYHKSFRGTLWNKLFRSDILRDVHFDINISYGEDALFCWHILQNAKTVAITEMPLYHYRMNQSSLSHSQFGPKKLSAHFVWEIICQETQLWWPHFLPIAQARHCIEDTLLLREAAHQQYKDKAVIQLLQKTILSTHKQLSKVSITSCSMRIYSFLASRCYWLASRL